MSRSCLLRLCCWCLVLVCTSCVNLIPSGAAQLEIHVLDHLGRATPARLNVIGSNHGYFEPRVQDNALSEFSLKRKGHRADRGPARYHGSFFYTSGVSRLTVPTGTTRIEVRKGYAHYPAIRTCQAIEGRIVRVEVQLVPVVDMQRHGWHGIDTHLHVQRESVEDKRLLHALAAEGVHFGHTLSMNPARVYSPDPHQQLEAEQLAGYGRRSIYRHPHTHPDRPNEIASGHEYRTRHLGHVTQLLIEDLVPANGRLTDTAKGPALATIYDQTLDVGGVMGHAHGGYRQELLSDLVLHKSDWVELLQFGHYRGIGLAGYYTALNSGFRYPLGGACDYPFCRTLADCMAYARGPRSADIVSLTGSLLRGETFATSGPLLFLSVDGRVGPGGQVDLAGTPRLVLVEVSMVSADLPVTEIEVIKDGLVVANFHPPSPSLQRIGRAMISVDANSWIAARCHGPRDARAHTNPVWISLDGRLPFDPAAAARLKQQVDSFRPPGIDTKTGAILQRARAQAAELANQQQGLPITIPTYPRGALPPSPGGASHLLPPITDRPAPAPLITVRGSVRTSAGVALPGATVSTRGGHPRGVTDAQGRFELTGVSTDRPLFLRVRKTGRMTTNTSYLNPGVPADIVCPSSNEVQSRFAAWARRDARVKSEYRTTRPIVEVRSPCPECRRKLREATASPNSTVLGFSARDSLLLGSTHVQFRESPDADNTEEPNLILSLPALGFDLVGPAYRGQLTSFSTGPCDCEVVPDSSQALLRDSRPHAATAGESARKTRIAAQDL